eukprot:57112_1
MKHGVKELEEYIDTTNADTKGQQTIENLNEETQIRFAQPQVDDYDICQNIRECKAIQRIIHLLQYYSQQTMMSKNAEYIVPIYEYISSLTTYAVPMVMDDWYHSKTKHFQDQDDYKWFKNTENNACYL